MKNSLDAAIRPNIEIHDGMPWLDAYDLGRVVGSRGDALVRKIDGHSRLFCDEIIPSTFVDHAGREHRSYRMTAEGMEVVAAITAGRGCIRVREIMHDVAAILREVPDTGASVPAVIRASVPAVIRASVPAPAMTVGDMIKLFDRWRLCPASEQLLFGKIFGIDVPAPPVAETWTAAQLGEEFGLAPTVVGKLLHAVKFDASGDLRPENVELRLTSVPVGDSRRDTPVHHYTARGRAEAVAILRAHKASRLGK